MASDRDSDPIEEGRRPRESGGMDGLLPFAISAAHTDIVRQAIVADRSARARVGDLARWILEDPGRVRGIDGLAERAAMSRRNLARVFLAVTELTPSQFVERARVMLAGRLLRETGLSAKAIASRCGFGNEERMRRAFNRVVGASPRRYATGLSRRSTRPIRCPDRPPDCVTPS